MVPGPATQACQLLGPVRCRELFSKAVASQHTDVLVAAQVLRAGQGTTACAFLGPKRCRMPLRKAAWSKDRQVLNTLVPVLLISVCYYVSSLVKFKTNI